MAWIKRICWCSACVRPPQKNGADMVPVGGNDLEDKDVILVKSIDPCLYVNGSTHHTSKYELMRRQTEPHLVIRRGEPFQLHITLSRPYDQTRDLISFIFKATGESKRLPNFGQGTLVAVSLSPQQEASCSWKAVLKESNENIITVLVTPSPICIVAKWIMEVDTKTTDTANFIWDTNVYILFNPWCAKDEVWMESEEWRDEAVVNSDGLIWRGTWNNFRPVAWKFAQYEKNILDCALYLMTDIGGIAGNLRSNPIEISRALSAAVNAQDDNGVLVGNWGTDFSKGTPPSQWNGSLEILSEYYEKKKPVKYAQCWVFAGVLTTVCRALGLPARVVTNFASAHDSDESMTIDNFVDATGKIVEDYSDSIWNFHVWTEAWMKRPDLGATYDGWQAIDSTPQEKSRGKYRCGPASIIACKQGDVQKPYDVPFVFAEVNADVVYWHLNPADNQLKLLGKETLKVGKFISTKAPGVFQRLDLTDSYKYEENGKEERAINMKAVRQAEHMFSKIYINQNFEDIIFSFQFLDDIVIGQTFDVSLLARNANTERTHTIRSILRVDLITYTGKFLCEVKTQMFTNQVEPNGNCTMTFRVSYEEYSKHLKDNCAFNISCLAEVEGTNFSYFDRDEFRVKMPDVQIELKNEAKEGQQVKADVVIKNPLPVTLKKAKFFIEAPGFDRQLTLNIKEDILPGHRAKQNIMFKPIDPGRHTIVAKFVSKQLRDVDGFLNFVVKPKQ